MKKKYKNEAEIRGILAIQVFRNLKMRPTLGTSRPQRQILYSASKGVNSSVGLCFSCGHLQK